MCAIWLAAVDGSSPPAKLSAITLTASLIDQAERFLPELVTSARLNGHTWHDIAQALATSPDEARLRFDPDSPVADGRWRRASAPRLKAASCCWSFPPSPSSAFSRSPAWTA